MNIESEQEQRQEQEREQEQQTSSSSTSPPPYSSPNPSPSSFFHRPNALRNQSSSRSPPPPPPPPSSSSHHGNEFEQEGDGPNMPFNAYSGNEPIFNRYTPHRGFSHRGGIYRPYRRFYEDRRDGNHYHFKQQYQQHRYYKPGFKKQYQSGAMSPSMPSHRAISPPHLTINTPQAPPPPQMPNNNQQQLTPVKTPTGSPFQPSPFGRSSMPSSASSSSSMFSRQYFPSPPRTNAVISSPPPPPPSNDYPSPSASPKYRPYNFYDQQSSSLSYQKQQYMQQQQQHLSQIQNPTLDHMLNELKHQKNLKATLPHGPEFVIDALYDQEMYNNLVEVNKLREEQAILQKKCMQDMYECLQIDFKVFHSKLEYEQHKEEEVFFDQLIQKYKDSLTEITNQHQQNQQLQESD